MAQIKEEYHKYLEDLEKNIKDKEDLAYIKNRTASFMNAVLDYVDYALNYKENQIKTIETIQAQLEEKIKGLAKNVAEIKQDIYLEDMEDVDGNSPEDVEEMILLENQDEEDYDTEIVCPYCETEFLVDLSQELKEVQCPECNNIIELDWTGNLEEEPELNNGCGAGKCSKCPGCRPQEDNEDDM